MARVARVIWALCLGLGTCMHVAALVFGWNDGDLPTATVVYWNALTLLDPLAAVLLFLRPRVGVLLTVAIMVSDVAHNVWALRALDIVLWPVIAQAVFLVFVLATARLIWREAPARKIASSPTCS